MTDDRALELAEVALNRFQKTFAPPSKQEDFKQALKIIARIRHEHDPKNAPHSSAGFVTR